MTLALTPRVTWQRLAYVLCTRASEEERIVAVSLTDGGTEEVVESCSRAAAVSADGQWLAFSTYVGDRNGTSEVRLLGIGTVVETRAVTTTEAPVRDIFWSPNGDRLAFASDEWLVVIAPDGTDRRLLVASRGGDEDLNSVEVPREPQWSPDGSRIAYVPLYYEGTGRVSVVKLADGEVSILGEPGAYGVHWLGTDRLAYGRDTGEFGGVIWTSPMSGSGDKALTDKRVGAYLVEVSPDFRQAIISISPLGADGPSVDTIWTCDLATGRLGFLAIPTPTEGSLYWSADGTIYSCGGGRLIGFRLTH